MDAKTAAERSVWSPALNHQLGNHGTGAKQFAPRATRSNAAIWHSSINNMVSTDNLTDELVKESMIELEKALQESKRLLAQRDTEITALREQLETRDKDIPIDATQQEELLDQLRQASERVLSLETELRATRTPHDADMDDEDPLLVTSDNATTEKSNATTRHNEDFPACTCYCGTMCGALREATAYKRKLEATERKYGMLKQRIRDRRRMIEAAARGNGKMGAVAEKSACVLQ